jgi:hypothetical protein
LAFLGFLVAKDARAYGVPPVMLVPPVGISVLNGDTATFTTLIGVSLTPLTVKWYFNGSLLNGSIKGVDVSTTTDPILGTTLSTVTITNASSLTAGIYSVVARNNGGQIVNSNAVLVILNLSSPDPVSLVTQGCGKTNNGFRLQVHKSAQSNCVIEATTDFINWVPIATNSSVSTNITYVDPAATNLVTRYYRVRYQ